MGHIPGPDDFATVADPVAVKVLLLRVEMIRAIVAGITKNVAIAVILVGIIC